jgi:hypothetical protein
VLQAKIDTQQFMKDMNNIVQYSTGFLDGIQTGKKEFMNKLGEGTINALGQYIDAHARMNPRLLHHVYEWYQTGSPSSRLFDLEYTVSNLGLSIKSTFRQSTTVAKDSTKPFYDKARIMENGIPVTIRPRGAQSLKFTVGGKTVFSKGPITVYRPGGDGVAGQYERIFDEFMNQYFTQAFLHSSGVFKYLQNPVLYKNNFAQGAKGGAGVGKKTGYRWIANATIGVQ